MSDKLKELMNKRNQAFLLLNQVNDQLQTLRISKCKLVVAIDEVDQELEVLKREFNLERMRRNRDNVNSGNNNVAIDDKTLEI